MPREFIVARVGAEGSKAVAKAMWSTIKPLMLLGWSRVRHRSISLTPMTQGKPPRLWWGSSRTSPNCSRRVGGLAWVTAGHPARDCNPPSRRTQTRARGGGVKSVAGHGDGKPRTHFASENLGTVKCWAGDVSERGWERRRVLFTRLLGRTSGHRSAGALLRRSPHHPIGRTPAQSPSCGGALSARLICRACVAAGPDCYPPLPKRAPHARQSGPPSHRISEMSVRLFMARTLARRAFRISERSLAIRCGKRATPEQSKTAPVGINWNGLRINGL